MAHLHRVHRVGVDAGRQLLHEGLAQERDADPGENENREAKTARDERIREVCGYGVLDFLHKMREIERAGVLVYVPQGVGNHSKHVVQVLLQRLEPLQYVVHALQHLVHIERAVPDGLRLVQACPDARLHWHGNLAAGADLHPVERRHAQVAVRVVHDAQLDVRVARHQQLQVRLVGAQAAVPVDDLVLPVVAVVAVVVLLALDDFEPARGHTLAADRADVHSRDELQEGVHIARLAERQRPDGERMVERRLAVLWP